MQQNPSQLLQVVFDELCKLLDVVFLVFLHFIPERGAFIAAACVFFVMISYAPQAFLLLDELAHKVIEMIVIHKGERRLM